MSVDVTTLTIASAARLIQSKDLSPVELTCACLERIERLNPKLNAYITVTADTAKSTAREAEGEIIRGHYRGPLHGIPISVKDMFYTKGVRTTLGDKRLDNFVPDYDATVVAKLKNAGAVIVGKAHVPGPSPTVPDYGYCRNPWNLERTPGISSGGGGAAVSVCLDFASIGSDNAGSVRYPAALCGVVGLKPTFGRVSRFGLRIGTLSQDYPGPLTRTAADAALVLRTIAGHDARDPYSARVPVPDYSNMIDGSMKGIRVGVPKNHFWDYLHPEVEVAARRAIVTLEELGCSTMAVFLPSVAYVTEIGDIIAIGETATFHQEHYKTQPEAYNERNRGQIEIGSMLLAVDYVRAEWLRRRMVEEIDAALDLVDVLVVPTWPIPAPYVGQTKFESKGKKWDNIMAVTAVSTRPFNVSGHPAVSTPAGFTTDGLPTAIQIVGKYFDEATILRVADAFQRVTDWHLRRPPLE